LLASDLKNPVVILSTGKGKHLSEEQINLSEFIDVKGWKSIGNKFATNELSNLELLPPDPTDEIDELVQADEPETLVNEDLFTQEQERIKKLLEDDSESDEVKKPRSPKIDPEQPKLF
jgi:hypothetical protein